MINEENFIFEKPVKIYESNNDRIEVKFDDYFYEIDFSGNVYFKTKYDLLRLDNDSIAFYTKDGLSGLLDNNGRVTIQPKYQIFAPLRHDKYYSFFDKSKWGLIDRDGNIKVPAIYDADFEHLGKNYYVAHTMDGDGVIDENGNIILPFDYDDCSIYFWDNKKDKFTALKNESQKCGVINLKNETIIPFMYDWIERCFSEGKHKGCAIAKLNNKEGIINQKNEIIVPFEYEYIKAMSDDTFLICKKYGECEYIVDNNFNQISDKKFLEILTGYDHITTDYFIASLDDENKEGLIDKFGNTIIDFKYKDLSMIENPHNKSDFYLYAKNDYDKCGIIDIEENVIVPFEYDYAPAIEIDNDYSAPMAKNGKWGVINIKTNEILVDFVYEDIYSYYNRETTFAKYNGKYGVINKQGQSIKYNLSDLKEIII